MDSPTLKLALENAIKTQQHIVDVMKSDKDTAIKESVESVERYMVQYSKLEALKNALNHIR